MGHREKVDVLRSEDRRAVHICRYITYTNLSVTSGRAIALKRRAYSAYSKMIQIVYSLPDAICSRRTVLDITLQLLIILQPHSPALPRRYHCASLCAPC